MAKNKKLTINDDFDLDANLDLGNFNFMEPDIKDDRKPVRKVVSSIPSGMKSGLKDTRFLKRVLKNLLPKGYGEAIDLYDKISDSTKTIYSNSLKEIKPGIQETKRVLPKLIPQDSKRLPKKAKDILKRWEEESKVQSKTLSPDQMREAMLSQQMSDVFKFQTEQEIKNRNEDLARDKLQQGIDIIRHREIMDVGTRQSGSIANIEKYLTNIDIAVKKKQLEVGYRQLFAVQDVLQHLKQDSIKRDEQLIAISKNTSLPDFVKLQDKEILKMTTRNKFAEQLTRGLFGDRNNFIERIAKNVNDRITESLKQFSDGVSQGLTAAEMMKDMSGNMGDPYVLAGQTLGSSGIQMLGQALASKYKDKFLNTKVSKRLGIKQKGTKLESLIENLPGKMTDFKRRDLSFETGMLGLIGPLIQDLLPGGIDKSLDVSNSKNILGPAPFTRRTDKSINEIIPGYLARILREVQVIRTGNKNIELVKYNFDTNRFSSQSKITESLFKEIIPKDAIKNSNRALDDIVSDIESKTGISLDANTKKLLKTSLLRNSAGERSSKLENLISKDSIGNSSANNKKVLENIYKEYYQKLTPEERLIFDRKHNRLGQGISDTRGIIQNNVDIGNMSELKRLGLIGKKNTINTDAILAHYLNNDEGLGDIFVGNNPNPVITKIKLKAKQYYDKASGKVIETFSDIKGTVVDKAGRIILDASEIPDSLVLDNKTKKFKKLEDIYSGLKSKTFKFTESVHQNFNSSLDRFKKNIFDSNKPEQLDLFVENESEPRLKNFKIKLGQYRNKDSGEIITHYTDIKDTVLDEKGNVVLDKNEIDKLRVLDPVTKTHKKIRVFNYSKYVNEFTNSISKPAMNLISSMKDKIVEGFKGISDKINDVYIKGEEKPRLLAVKLKQGLYRDKASGKVITDIRLISGDVIDENNNTVIASEEIPKMVVFEPNVKQFTSVKLLGKIGRLAWDYQTKIAPKWVAFNFRMIGKGLNLIKDTAMVAIRGFVKDVFVGNEKEPRMYAERIKNGYYFLRSSGKVITHQNQIVDEVIDKFGNVVIAYDELENLRVYTNIFKWLNPYTLAKAAGKVIFKGLWGATKLGLKATKFVATNLIKGAGKLLDKSITYLTKPVDVYVSSKAKPVILARDLKEGKYFSAKTGARIYHHRDIDGEVIDEDGNVILSNEEAQSGLFDITGKKIRPGLAKLAMLGLKKLNRLFSIRTKLNNGKFMNKTMNDIDKSGLSTGDAINTKSLVTLKAIKDILDDRFKKKSILGDVDGDGVRENSYLDKIRKRVSGKKDDNNLKPDGKEDKDKSFLGKLLSILGTAAGGLIAKFSGFLNLFNSGALGIVGNFAKSGFSMIGSLVSTIAKVLPNIPGLSNIASTLFKGAAKIALPAAAIAGAGYAIDAGLGKLGIGKDENGKDIKLDLAQDDANWKKMTTLQKVQSGAARGIEKVGSLFFLDNLAREAANTRIKKETGYLNKQSQPDQYDSEDKSYNRSKGGSVPTRSPGTLKQATGPLYDGRNALSYLSLDKGVTLKNMNPELLKAFYGMVEEYGILTGKKVHVTAGSRSYEDQLALYQKYGPGRAAPPGKSLHEFGLAFDADSKSLDEMDNLGLMRKYGFTRPVGAEPWHVEPIGIQPNITHFKKNQLGAVEAIKAGYNKGGGGLGVIPSANKYSRDTNHSAAIMMASGSLIDNTKLVKANYTIKPDPMNQNDKPNVVRTNLTPSSGKEKPTTNLNYDTEPKLSDYGKTTTGIDKRYNTSLPNDPSVKLPDGDIHGIVTGAAKTVGLDPDLMLKVTAVESGFDPNAKAKGSSGAGLFQFVDATWKESINKHGSKYGYTLANTSPYDPKANALMGAHYIKNNISSLKTPSGIVSATDAYMTLFLGKSGATKFLNTLNDNPNEFGSRILPEAARSNPDIFFTNGRSRTVQEIYSLLQTRVNTKASSFGIKVDTSDTVKYTGSSQEQSGYMKSIYQTKTPLEKSMDKPSAFNIITDKNNTPFNRVYGTEPTNNRSIGVNENLIPKDLMVNTESLLSNQVEIQSKILSELIKIREHMFEGQESTKTDSNPPASNESSNKSPFNFTPASPRVKMIRNT